MEIEVFDNYLPDREYSIIHDCMMGYNDGGDIHHSFTWNFVDHIASSPCPDKYFQFIHILFMDHTILSPYFDIVKPIIKKESMVALNRIKCNMIIGSEELKIFKNSFHCDVAPKTAEKITTAIYYVNNNNGFTLFEDGTKVESIGNRLVKFPGYLKHTGTTCTDANRRSLINFNYYI